MKNNQRLSWVYRQKMFEKIIDKLKRFRSFEIHKKHPEGKRN